MKAMRDVLGAYRLALVVVRAVAKAFGVHLRDHLAHAVARAPAAPCGKSARCAILAEVNSAAEAFGQAATQAPQPMQAAASKAESASGLGTGSELASGAVPVRTEM